jgi:hypothetical protein
MVNEFFIGLLFFHNLNINIFWISPLRITFFLKTWVLLLDAFFLITSPYDTANFLNIHLLWAQVVQCLGYISSTFFGRSKDFLLFFLLCIKSLCSLSKHWHMIQWLCSNIPSRDTHQHVKAYQCHHLTLVSFQVMKNEFQHFTFIHLRKKFHVKKIILLMEWISIDKIFQE